MTRRSGLCECCGIFTAETTIGGPTVLRGLAVEKPKCRLCWSCYDLACEIVRMIEEIGSTAAHDEQELTLAAFAEGFYGCQALSMPREDVPF